MKPFILALLALYASIILLLMLIVAAWRRLTKAGER